MHARTTPINISRHVERSRVYKKASHTQIRVATTLVKEVKVADREKQRVKWQDLSEEYRAVLLLLFCTKIITFS